MTIGGIAFRSRRYEEAQSILGEVEQEFSKQLGRTAIFTFRVEQELARCLFESGDPTGARIWYAKSVNKQRDTLGPDNHETLSGEVRLARVLIALGEYEEAEKLLLNVITIFDRRHGQADPVTLRARLELADAYEGQGNMPATLSVQQTVLRENRGRLHKCPWILKGIARSARRSYMVHGRGGDAPRAQQLAVEMSLLQDEPTEETAKRQVILRSMREGRQLPDCTSSGTSLRTPTVP